MKRIYLIAPILLSICIISCGVYTFSSSTIGSIKSVSIPLIEDRSTEGVLGTLLTDKLSDAFVKDNTLQVTPEQKADGIIRGAIVSYKREAYTYSQQEIVSEYICTITANIQFAERKSGKVVWEQGGMSSWGTYNSDSELEDDGKNRALDKLVEDILNRTVKGW